MSPRDRKITFAVFAAVCAAIGLALRALYLYQFSTSPLCDVALGPDVQEYAAWARRILAGETLWTSVHIHSPLYPYFLAILYAAFSSDIRAICDIRAFQLFIGLLSAIPLCAAIALSARRHASETETSEESESTETSERTERKWDATLPVFMLLWAWYPPLIYYFGELTSEVIVVPLLSSAVFFLYRWETPGKDGKPRSALNAAAAGLAAGLAVTAHPMSVFFLAGETIYILVRTWNRFKKARALVSAETKGKNPNETLDEEIRLVRPSNILKPFAAFLALALIPIALVAFRNVALLGSDSPLQANGGFNFYLGNGPGADGTCHLRPGPDWDAFHAKTEAEAEKLGISKDRYLTEKTFKHIAERPGEWLAVLGKKALYAWNAKEISAGADLHPLRYYTPFQQAFPWAFGICAAFALTAIFFHIADKNFLYRHRHFIILAMAFFLAQTLLVASGRYRVGALPGILVLAAAGVDTIIRAIAEPSRRYLAILPSAALAAVVVFLPSPPFDEDREMGEACTIMGEALIRQGKLDDAEKCVLAAMSKQPTWTRNHNLMGLLMEKENQPLKAKMYYLNAVKLDPDDPEGYTNLATLCDKEGDAKHAASLYEKALSLKRPSPTLYYNYALFKAESGDIRAAAEYYLKCLDLDPADARALNNLATIEIQVGNPGAAVELLRTAVKLDPQNPNRSLNLVLALLLSGKRGEAEKVFKRCLELGVDPDMLKKIKTQAKPNAEEKKTPAEQPKPAPPKTKKSETKGKKQDNPDKTAQ